MPIQERKKIKEEKAAEIVPPESLAKELADARKDIALVERRQKTLVVESPEDVQKAANILVELKRQIKAVKARYDYYADPIKEALERISGDFKPALKCLKDMELAVEGAVSKYTVGEAQKRRAEEAKLQAKEIKKSEKAVEIGAPVDFKVMPTIAPPPRVVAAKSGGSAAFDLVWKHEVMEPELVPRRYCKPDDAEIRKAVADGVRNIAGVRIFEDVKTTTRTS